MCKASFCKPLAPWSQALAFFSTQEGFSSSFLIRSTLPQSSPGVGFGACLLTLSHLRAALYSSSKCPFHLALIISREYSAPELSYHERHSTSGSQLTVANALDPRKILCSNYTAIIRCASTYSSGARRACAMYLNLASLSCR